MVAAAPPPVKRGSRRVAALGSAALALALLTGCVSPALDRGAYTQDAVRSLESAIGSGRTTQLAITAYLSGDATTPYTDVALTEAEDAIAPVEAAFGTVDPPSPVADDLRSHVLTVLGELADTLADARIALRRHDLPGLREARATLVRQTAAMQRDRDALQ